MEKEEDPVLQKFYLYHTAARYYLVAHTKDSSQWRILKFSREDSSALEVSEDPTVYTERECSVLLKQINDGNKHHGGLQFVCQV